MNIDLNLYLTIVMSIITVKIVAHVWSVLFNRGAMTSVSAGGREKSLSSSSSHWEDEFKRLTSRLPEDVKDLNSFDAWLNKETSKSKTEIFSFVSMANDQKFFDKTV